MGVVVVVVVVVVVEDSVYLSIRPNTYAAGQSFQHHAPVKIAFDNYPFGGGWSRILRVVHI